MIAGLVATLCLAPASVIASGEEVGGALDTFDVPPGGTVTITFQVTVDGPPLPPGVTSVANQGTLTGDNFAPLPTDDRDDSTSSADPTVTGIDSADLSITKDDGATTAVPGDPIVYTVTVSNAGPNDAVGATVTDSFPAALVGASWTCAASAGSSCTAGPVAGDLADTVTVLAGGTLTYTVTATIAPGATGSLVNTATVGPPATTQDPLPGNDSATDTDTLTPEADLAITKDNGLASVTAGSPTTYTITVTNSGPSDASGATIADTFPAELSGVTWTCSASAGSSCTAAGAGDIADTVTVLAGGTLTYTATGTVDFGATGTLANTATVTAPAGVIDPDGGNDSSTDSDPIAVEADLSITKDDGVTAVTPGTSVTYTITAANAGPSDVVGATVADPFPAELTCTWTCAPQGSASCTAGPVAGDVADTVDLPVGDSVTYTAVCAVADLATGTLSNTATVAPPVGATDPNGANDSATDVDTLRQLDFGDAPDPTYPTLLASDGARHGIDPGLVLGAAADGEADGQPAAGADGDDLAGADDEDGVVFGALVACETADVTVTASAVGLLDAWVDWNADGDFLDSGEQVFTSEALAAGPNARTVSVPCAAGGDTVARFRLSASGGLAPDGVAERGEVEDHAVTIAPLDFGDAPDPTYPTLFASDGARHALGGALFLGAAVDAEVDGQPSAGADGDDLAGGDDEDGVVFTSPLHVGETATVDVTASGAGLLTAWIDWNGDGAWADPGERVFADEPVAAGVNGLAFAVPATAPAPLATFARFRVSTAGGDAPAGLAADGEVEDHAVDVLPAADLAITKDDDADPPPGDANLTWTITVDNLGPSDATGVVVTDNLPAGVTLVATSGCAEDPNGVPTCTLGAIPNGGSAAFTIEVSIDPAPPASISNTASVAGDQHDPVPANDSDTEETTLDVVPPEVASLDTVAGSGGGELAECETARVAVGAFRVVFTEPVLDAGPGAPASVTNAANYRLVRPAAGSGFDTASCASGPGTDTVVPIDAVDWDEGSAAARVVIGGGPLADGIARFVVCGTIEDPAGNALDGGSGPGSDLVRTFRVDRDNLFADARFDTSSPACDLGAWTPSSPAAVDVAAPDAGGSPLSGSVHNTDPFGGFGLEQCVPILGGRDHAVSVAVRVDTAPANPISFELACDFFAGAACTGAPAGSEVFAWALGDTAGDFLALADGFTAPAGATSGTCGVDAEAPLGGAFDVFVDDLVLGADVEIFADGFESGDTTAWSAVAP